MTSGLCQSGKCVDFIWQKCSVIRHYNNVMTDRPCGGSDDS